MPFILSFMSSSLNLFTACIKVESRIVYKCICFAKITVTQELEQHLLLYLDLALTNLIYFKLFLDYKSVYKDTNLNFIKFTFC